MASEDPGADGSQMIVSRWSERDRESVSIVEFHRFPCIPRVKSGNQYGFEKGILGSLTRKRHIFATN